MNDYADSSNRAASGKNNQSSFAIHYAKASRIRKASEDKPTNNKFHFLLEALKLLSRRESEVLQKVAEGKTNREIADEFCLSVRTIENTRARICKKLDLKGRGSLKKWTDTYYKEQID
ncbi:MAG: hypothetical protein GVY20_01300 [Bacteroidetes bacterium]|jgi:DNA-binding NarL/FixJ family response regulator|nr:hypothetical protein [Bacteroidota bacterium]